MTGRQQFHNLFTAACFIAGAQSLAAAVQDDDRLHPDSQASNVGIVRSGSTPAQLDELVRLHPRSAVAYLERGNSYLADSEIEKALSDFNKAIELDPHCTRAYFGRYFVYSDGHHTAQALAALKKAAEIGPADLSIDALNLQASLHKDMKQYPEALAEYTRVINSKLFSKKRLSVVYLNRGVVSDRLGKIPAAITDYTSAVKLVPDSGQAYLFRANDYRDMGDFKRAKADYDLVANEVEHVPVEKRKSGFEMAKKNLYRFRSVFYTQIKRPDLAKADMTALSRQEREDVDMAPFQGK
jgi:tetratricopeptide (TPR) repeat protein